MEATRPTRISKWAVACLEAIAGEGLGTAISLGGALGLMHYLDYRETRDVDAWWSAGSSAAEKEKLLSVVEETLSSFGTVDRRSWGDVVSLDLREKEEVVFSFQVASRSALLESSVRAPWVDVPVDSLSDLLASKMVALVERGAPRDFRDIYMACSAGLATAVDCWQLWRRRQAASKSDTDQDRARLAVETHLQRIESHRPLETISDAESRSEAERVRAWFKGEFLDAFSD